MMSSGWHLGCCTTAWSRRTRRTNRAPDKPKLFVDCLGASACRYESLAMGLPFLPGCSRMARPAPDLQRQDLCRRSGDLPRPGAASDCAGDGIVCHVLGIGGDIGRGELSLLAAAAGPSLWTSRRPLRPRYSRNVTTGKCQLDVSLRSGIEVGGRPAFVATRLE